jgi:hypothetical protein
MQAQRRGAGILSTHSQPRRYKRGGGQHHVPAIWPDTHRTGGWVGIGASLDGYGKSRPNRDSIPGLSSPSRVAISTTLFSMKVTTEINLIIYRWDSRSHEEYGFWVMTPCSLVGGSEGFGGTYCFDLHSKSDEESINHLSYNTVS